MHNTKDSNKFIWADFCFLAMSATFMTLLGVVVTSECFYITKHTHFKPVKGLTATQDSLVYSIGDSLLTARKARYDGLTDDYHKAASKMYAGWFYLFPAYSSFEEKDVRPMFATQIGVKNIHQYHKYLNRYEQDSLGPVYKDVYKNKATPLIRNNTSHKR